MPDRRTPLLLTLAAALAACATEPESISTTAPALDAVGQGQVVVGESLFFYGRNLDAGEGGRTRLLFHGTYANDDGSQEPVDLAVTAVFEGLEGPGGDPIDVVRWSRFGPFDNPFSAYDRPGVFSGEVRVELQGAKGETRHTEAREMRLEVLPSLLIDELQPLDAGCSAPALRAFGGIAYRMTVRAVGIKPVRFVYELNRINGADGATTYEHVYDPATPVATDSLGLDEPVFFNPVPADEKSYVTGIRVLAFDAENRMVETALPLSVNRPIEVVYDGKIDLAEYFEPTAVSGCTPGSLRTEVTYSETRTETRQQSVSVTVSNHWLRSQSTAESRNFREGISSGQTSTHRVGGSESEREDVSEGYGLSYESSESNDIDYRTTDGETWSWNLTEGETAEEYASRMNRIYGEGSYSTTVGAEAEGSVPGFAKVSGSVSATAGVTVGAGTAGTQGGTTRRTSERGHSMAGESAETRSFGSTTAESRSQSISGSYALGRARDRSFQDEESRSDTRTWDVSQGTSEEQAVSEGMTATEEQSWVTSESLATERGLSGQIPRTRAGMFYRQTTRWVRRAQVRAYDLCGVAEELGELQFNEWTWAAELALGKDCGSSPPKTKLPAARCFIPPCGG